MAAEKINIHFVQEVEKYPCLYDFRLPEYSRRDATEKAWEEIGAKFQLAGAECKERWKNLRSVFVRHLKPAKHGSGRQQKKPYYLSEYMQFALPFVKSSNNEMSDNIKQTSQEVNIDYVIDEEANEHTLSTNSQSIYQFESTSTTSLSNLETESTELTIGLQSRSPNSSACQSLASPSEIRPIQENKNLKRKQFDHSNDEHSSNRMFLLSFLSDINKMNDKQRRVFKRKLLCLVDEILDNDDVSHNSNTFVHTNSLNNSKTVVMSPNNFSNELNSVNIDHTLTSNSSVVIKSEYQED